jgi:hypothetical protein
MPAAVALKEFGRFHFVSSPEVMVA